MNIKTIRKEAKKIEENLKTFGSDKGRDLKDNKRLRI